MMDAALTMWQKLSVKVRTHVSPLKSGKFTQKRTVSVLCSGEIYIISIYRLGSESMKSPRNRRPRAPSCSVPSAARTLLGARGLLLRGDFIGRAA